MHWYQQLTWVQTFSNNLQSATRYHYVSMVSTNLSMYCRERNLMAVCHIFSGMSATLSTRISSANTLRCEFESLNQTTFLTSAICRLYPAVFTLLFTMVCGQWSSPVQAKWLVMPASPVNCNGFTTFAYEMNETATTTHISTRLLFHYYQHYHYC